MKQMTLIEMDGFLKGKCIPSDLKVNETNAEYLVRKFAEAEAKISALSEDHQKAIESIKQADAAVKLAHEKFSALAAENAALKAGAMYFSYGSEFSFECHKTAEEAIAAAEAAIDDYRGDACDGWSEEVESICWGVIIQQATKVGERKKRKCDRVSPWIERVCDYELRPNVETPATDAFLAEIRAEARNEGINYTASRLAAAFNHGFINKSLREVFDVTRMILSAKEELANEPYPIDGLSGEYAEKSLEEWAEQIRKGGNQ
ncbi:ead/Ea22-like family protein [Escherichia coli]|uniref:ead/Ea22-like family protein n=1 Tax=Escherichia coli TaxID=562 RepID=UPI0020327F92|nr:ead/Ea22-like family protein [Escherichia coli]